MSSSRKKVIVRRFSPGVSRGYLDTSGFVQEGGGGAVLQLLDLAGRTQELPLRDVKLVSFVREFYLNDEVNPERLPRKTFLARPRTEGLWIRLGFSDGDQMEGLAPIDLSLADGLLLDRGLHIIPPDVRGNTQRVFVPRSALDSLQIVAVVTSPVRRKALESLPERSERTDRQPGLFAPDAAGSLLPQ